MKEYADHWAYKKYASLELPFIGETEDSDDETDEK
jgi:hypothetical protein